VQSRTTTFRARSTVGQEQVQLSAAHPARAVRLRVPKDVAAHDHSYHEVCVVLSGKAVHETANYRATLRAGTAFIVPPGQVHAISGVTDNLTVINVYYLAEWLTADLALLWQHPGLVPLFLGVTLFRPVSIPQFAVPEPLFASITHELAELETENQNTAPSPVILRASLLKALANLTRAHAATGSDTASLFTLRQEIWQSLQFIDDRIAHNRAFHLPELADDIGVSPDHLTRLFKSATGRNPTQYFQHRRIHKACHLLLDPRLSITTIAHALGYADAPHLTRMFKKYRRLTPQEYRRMFTHPIANDSLPSLSKARD
jgi:AraC-like DNA-binding protein/quercetin dioxygenase-like cupin family protein